MTIHMRFWLLFAVGVCLVPRSSEAQLAPTGAHYAARATDTGFSGPSESGSYTTSVPLDLPPARAGLPLPVQIVSGTRGYGAFGVGWDIPFSYVYVDDTIAHRRPALGPGGKASARQHITLSLLGRVADMMFHDGNIGSSTYIGRNAADIELRHRTGVNEIDVYDSNGLTYVFTQLPELQYPDNFSGLWLLSRIDGPGHASVKLTYSPGTYTMPMPGVPPAATINLTKVAYNHHPTSDCYKNEVDFIYEASGGSQPYQSLQVLGERLLVRRTKVVEVRATSRATCGAAPELLRTYTFHYLPEPDTQLDQLRSVDVSVPARANEPSKTLPIARYGYGTATTGFTPSLTFNGSDLPAITLPVGAKEGIAWTERQSVPFQLPPVASHPAGTLQSLIDMTGDGRPDLVFSENGKLMIAKNVATASGVAFGPKVSLNDQNFSHGALDVHSFKYDRFAGPTNSHANEDSVWTQTIDVNGDGRLDVIDAARKPGVWLIYLNTPDSTYPSGIKWNRRAVDVSRLVKELRGRGWEIPGDYLPLSRRVTGRDYERDTCWVYTDNVDAFGHHIYVSHPEYVRDWQHPNCKFNPDHEMWTDTEKTFTEWQLQDVNGDGYPDFVWNEKPALFKGTTNTNITSNTGEVYGYERVHFELHNGSNVFAAYNVRGVFIGGDQDPTKPLVEPFSAPFELDRENAGCGIEKWAPGYGRDDVQVMECGFIDMNGDGIADRYSLLNGSDQPLNVSIGSGSYFNAARFKAPFVAKQENNYNDRCPNQPASTWYASVQTSAIRDITGDGVPDLIERDASNGWTISPGTAAGFDTQHKISTSLELSRVDEECDGRTSRTAAGLLDLDGDGQPEIVTYSGGKLWMAALRDGYAVGRPAAGRLLTIDSGTGSTIAITYRSAKNDPFTEHQIPSSEVVVDSIRVVGHGGPLSANSGRVATYESLGGDLVRKQFAYGKISMIFDSALEAFRPTGYLRRIELVQFPGRNDKSNGQATITDSYDLEAYSNGLHPNERLARYLKVGRPKQVTVIAGYVGSEPWGLLGTDFSADTRRIAGTNYVTGINHSRVFGDVMLPAEDLCTDMVYPYDYDASKAIENAFPADAYQPCKQRGFLYSDYVSSWRGQLAPPAIANVETAWSVQSVDDYGRTTSVYVHGDEYRGDDDYCIDTTFAVPVSQVPRVRSAPYTRKIYTCGKEGPTRVLAEESFEYDKQAPGLVAQGIATAHTVYLHATDTGEHLRTIREMDITLDGAGNPSKIERRREDDATQTTTITYDEFGLVATRSSLSGTGVEPLTRTMDVDPITEYVRSATDANGTTTFTTYDGFGRRLLTKVRGPTGTPDGVLAAYAYYGFEGGDPLGRRILTKTFTDPVAEQNIWTEEGHTSTTFLDELGRERYTSVGLGDDYANQNLIVGAKKYDLLGRVAFTADAYPTGQDPASTYGTSVVYNDDSSVAAEIRGYGPQTLQTTDPAVERFPTVYKYQFANHEQLVSVQGPDELLSGTPQYGVSRQTRLSATDRALSRATYFGTSRLEYSDYGYDRLGHLSRVSRYLIPSTATVPNDWTYRFDSQGSAIEVREPDVAPQYRSFSDFGELKYVTYGGSAPAARVVASKYDAFGRLIESHEENNGVINDETVVSYRYDTASPTLPRATNLLGRLASASAKTSSVDLSYDDFGNVSARRFVDSTQTQYVEHHQYHADGSLDSLTLQLPDGGYVDERVQYAYDSAGRARWISFDDGINTQELFNASNVDVLGRVRNAEYGDKIGYFADYSDVGRRLVRATAVTTKTGSREYSFGEFDPVGREQSRTERATTLVNGTTSTITGTQSTRYDSLGRLSQRLSTGAVFGASNWTFTYNALGNLTKSGDSFAQVSTVNFQHLAPDHDRICSVGYWGQSSSNTCSFKYDNLGGVRLMPAADHSTRELDYYNSGAVRSIRNNFNTVAKFAYDPFGRVGELDIYKNGELARADRNIGDFVTVREQVGTPPSSSKFIERKIPGPGVTITRRGTKGPWIFEFAEKRGVRFAVDGDGNFTQDINYSPFGIATNKGIGAGDPRFTTLQWNGGDGLESLGVVQVGARIYDPVLGRFLSRDPLMIPRDSTRTNPYAFAWNDPINLADPSGADVMGSVWKFFSRSDDNQNAVLGTTVGAALFAYAIWPKDQPSIGAPPEYTKPTIDFTEHLGLGLYDQYMGVVHMGEDPWGTFKALADTNLNPDRVMLNVYNDFHATYSAWKSGDPKQMAYAVAKVIALVGPLALERAGLMLAEDAVLASRVESNTGTASAALSIGEDQLAINGRWVRSESSGYFNVVSHGTPQYFSATQDGASFRYGAKEMADRIRATRGYTGQDVRLISCNTGACPTGVAQRLATELGVNVLAPIGLAWVDEFGFFWADGGAWNLFKP